MATAFKKGDVVQLNTVIPQGPVLALRMNDDGEVFCLVEWTDAKGVKQQRWFEESTLVAGD
jgi:uncharacterized protein YodC (DUF2158 family)